MPQFSDDGSGDGSGSGVNINLNLGNGAGNGAQPTRTGKTATAPGKPTLYEYTDGSWRNQ
jgi:hypothetical protein